MTKGSISPHQQEYLNIIRKYFPDLSPEQLQQFGKLRSLYAAWNEKINVVSRKDIDHLYERHVLHSLSIAKFISFQDQTSILDVGTGGGFPGIPLAILFPGSKFHLVDSIGKKIRIVQSVIEELNLSNAAAQQIRAEELRNDFDFIVSRAVAPIKTIFEWTRKNIKRESKNLLNNGWILLKGGDLLQEINELKKPVQLVSVSNYFEEPFFNEKYLVYLKR